MAANLISSLLSLANKLLPSTTASLSNSNNSQKGRSRAVEEDLKSMRRTLERIKDTLYDAEEREIRDRSVKHWLKELKEVAYDAEDVLSEYRYEVTRVQVEARKVSQASGSHERKQIEYIVQIPYGLVDRLHKIRNRFDEIMKDREALKLTNSDGVRRANNKNLRPPTGHMVDEASIFGRGAEKKEVIKFLLSENKESFSVISIVGKGGIGKTTIAQLVYKDQSISLFFDLFGWVCVSEEFDVRRLIKATIESVSKINCDLSELSPLQEELAGIVKGKTMLLVLDDVWNENKFDWESFLVPFKEAKMVRILVTTRHKKVAVIMQTMKYFYPDYLPEDSCWQLFQHFAFSGTNYTESPYWVGMGREIMGKCGGLPLAVKSIASLLRHEDEEGWKEILESDLWEKEESKEVIFPALEISYAHLPAHLKPCFLFCSMYPKDYILEKTKLIKLWMSHGYIESRGKKRITSIGVEYYKELKERSFLDDISGQSSECCKLHHIIHDLARLKSGNEHYSVEIDRPLDMEKENIMREAYHLYARNIMGYGNQIFQQNLKGLRTLSTDMGHCKNVPICNLTKFEALRVLELKGYSLTKIPDNLEMLKHLAYLHINSSGLKMLPSSIGLLYNLQTLILDCPFLEYLPESIGDLANLLILFIRNNYLKGFPLHLGNLCNLQELTIHSNQIQALPNTIGHLDSLEELSLYTLHGSVHHKLDYVPHGQVNFRTIKTMAAWLRVRTIAWLRDMKDLEGKLSIRGLENMSNLVDARHANLGNKCKLETLELCWYTVSYILPYYEKTELKLECLVPEACEGGLVGSDDVDFSLLECLQPHPNLKKLIVRWYPSAVVPGWMRDPSSFRSIQEVWLQSCHKIQSLPFSNLQTLKHLTIDECSSIRVLQLAQLSAQLEELQIFSCDRLELITGIGRLDMLAVLEISFCQVLKSLTMDTLQLAASSEPFGDSSHVKQLIGRQKGPSLTRLKIENCDLLHVLPDGLIPSGTCNVLVLGCGCPDLEIGHLQ